jgi:two-component system cell cycle response regulator DivK
VSGKVVLVVEDNEQNMELATFLLEEAGYEVRQAVNAAAARELLTRGLPDLFLMDMNLGDADGLSLVAELRKQAGIEQIPILALTAHAMRGDRERFLEGGCDGYIAKPIDVKTFVPSVAKALVRGRGPGGAGGKA